jgi:hypothetical protein
MTGLDCLHTPPENAHPLCTHPAKVQRLPPGAMTISGRISPYQKRITHQKSRKPLRKTHERLKNRPFRQYKNHPPIKFFLSIDGR